MKKPKELEELEYLRYSGILVTNQEITEQNANIPDDIDLSVDDRFDMCVLLAMKLKDDKNKTMTIYRLEHKESANGMWTEEYNGKFVVENVSNEVLATLPMPRDDRYRKDGKIWKVGVDDMESMYSWFTKEDIVEMMAMNFCMVRFETDDFIIEENQVLFNDASRKNQVDITEEFLKTENV